MNTPFQNNWCSRFVLSQTTLSLTKFIEMYINFEDTNLVKVEKTVSWFNGFGLVQFFCIKLGSGDKICERK
jgi:hypothetical protein